MADMQGPKKIDHDVDFSEIGVPDLSKVVAFIDEIDKPVMPQFDVRITLPKGYAEDFSVSHYKKITEKDDK